MALVILCLAAFLKSTVRRHRQDQDGAAEAPRLLPSPPSAPARLSSVILICVLLL